MRELSVHSITDAVESMCIRACYQLPADVQNALDECLRAERWPRAGEILSNIIENARIARQGQVPLCQDTGMACVFIELGWQVRLVDGPLREAVDEGVRRGYHNGYLRKSIVADPLRRENTLDNTPANLHVDIVEGDGCFITVLPKGFGSENASRIAMLSPSDGEEGVKRFVLETVAQAGAQPLSAGGGGRRAGQHVRRRGALVQARAAAQHRQHASGSLLCAHGSRASLGHQLKRHRAAGPGGKNHGAGRAHLCLSDAHRVVARGGEHRLPCHAPCMRRALKGGKHANSFADAVNR